MPSVHPSPSFTVRSWRTRSGGLAGVARALRGPRGDAARELDEARELLAYWELRVRRLPRWAFVRRREARVTARRWRERVRDAEQRCYGPGVLGAASQYAIERRMPAAVAHRGRQAVRVTAYAALTAALTVLLVFATAVAVIAGTLLGAL